MRQLISWAGPMWAGAAVLLGTCVACAPSTPDTDTPDTGTEAPQPAASGAPQQPSSGAAMWGANYFPNIPLTTHRGERVRFFDDLIAGKVVALNFIYTKCSDSCPMETARMLEVQKLLGDRVGRDVHFYSISIDPAHDTPEVLRAYAENWHVGAGWTFLTGADADITLLRKKLGVYDADITKKDHNLSLVIGNQKTGRWMKRSPFENPYILATQIGSWLHNWKLPSDANRDYAKAPEVRNITAGEEFFRTRCAVCHTIGEGDRSDVAQRRIGPDLFNITKLRDRDWLERWMMNPDKMIEAKDPLALALLAQYSNIAMPNLRLTQQDVATVLQFIEEESRGVERRAAARATVSDRGNTKGDGGNTVSNDGNTVSASGSPLSASGNTVSNDGNTVSASGSTVSASGNTDTRARTLDASSLRDARSTLARYGEMRERLADDDLAGARAAAARFVDERGGASPPGLGATMASTTSVASRIARATELAEARAAFGDLSRSLVALLVDHPQLRDGWRLFRCPMAPGYQRWLQTDAELKNPYWGSGMLRCGTELSDWSS